jgi:hypothetical protein
MNKTPQELKELFGDNAAAIERMLLVTMLQEALAGSPVAGAALHGVMEQAQPIKWEGANIDDMITSYGGLSLPVGEIKARLAAAESNVERKNEIIKEQQAALQKPQTGWCVPKRGDRLRLVKPVGNLIYGHDWIAVGDVVTCEAIGACIDSSITAPAGANNAWLIQTLPGVQFLKPGDETMIATIPLDFFEPVTETNNQGTP